MGGTQLGLHRGRRGRAQVVGRVGRHDDQVQVGRRQPGPLQGLAGSRDHHVRRRLVIGDDVALADPDLFHQPIADILAQHFVQVGVGDHLFRDVPPGGDDLCVSHDSG